MFYRVQLEWCETNSAISAPTYKQTPTSPHLRHSSALTVTVDFKARARPELIVARIEMATARTSFISHPPSSSSQNQSTNSGMSPELEQTLALLSSHRSVLGYILISRSPPGPHHAPSIIRSSGVIFEGEQGKKYASVIARIVQSVQSGLEEVQGDADPVRLILLLSHRLVMTRPTQDSLKFLRIRTKKHEIMISPGMYSILLVSLYLPQRVHRRQIPLSGSP